MNLSNVSTNDLITELHKRQVRASGVDATGLDMRDAPCLQCGRLVTAWKLDHPACRPTRDVPDTR